MRGTGKREGAAAIVWDPATQPESEGWMRHPDSGRRPGWRQGVRVRGALTARCRLGLFSVMLGRLGLGLLFFFRLVGRRCRLRFRFFLLLSGLRQSLFAGLGLGCFLLLGGFLFFGFLLGDLL